MAKPAAYATLRSVRHMLQSGHDGKLLWHPDPVHCAAASFQAASAVQLSQSKGSVYQTSDGYTRDPMIPFPPFRFHALGNVWRRVRARMAP